MLTIRKDQLGVFEDLGRRRFEDHLVVVLTTEYPGAVAVLEEPRTRRLVEHAVDLGAAHGIVTEGGVTALAGLMVQYGEAFERSPDRTWALRILEHPTLPGRLKIDLLIARMASGGRVVMVQGND